MQIFFSSKYYGTEDPLLVKSADNHECEVLTIIYTWIFPWLFEGQLYILSSRLQVLRKLLKSIYCAVCCARSLQLCPTLCHPMDCSLPGSSFHGILEARILKWVVVPSSRGSSRPGTESLSHTEIKLNSLLRKKEKKGS